MKRREKQRGQAVVEAALIMLVAIPALVGTMDFGQLIYYHQPLTERVRAASRWGAVNTFNATSIANVAIYNDPAGSANGATPQLPYLQTSDSSADAYVSAALSDAGTENARVRVTITNFPYNFLWLPSNTKKRTVTDTQPYEGN